MYSVSTDPTVVVIIVDLFHATYEVYHIYGVRSTGYILSDWVYILRNWSATDNIQYTSSYKI